MLRQGWVQTPSHGGFKYIDHSGEKITLETILKFLSDVIVSRVQKKAANNLICRKENSFFS